MKCMTVSYYLMARFKTTTPGAYRVCFDNTHTRYSRKSVALHMTAQDATGIGTNWEQYNRSRLEPEEDYGGKVKEIVVSFNRG